MQLITKTILFTNKEKQIILDTLESNIGTNYILKKARKNIANNLSRKLDNNLLVNISAWLVRRKIIQDKDTIEFTSNFYEIQEKGGYLKYIKEIKSIRFKNTYGIILSIAAFVMSIIALIKS